eukprot:m.424280 g.424280  ORF g.424280 m.424280 type:complete len:110 (+) comp45932_c0_seq1:86-415(+)
MATSSGGGAARPTEDGTTLEQRRIAAITTRIARLRTREREVEETAKETEAKLLDELAQVRALAAAGGGRDHGGRDRARGGGAGAGERGPRSNDVAPGRGAARGASPGSV